MRGISEEKLISIFNAYSSLDGLIYTSTLINKCEELNAWQPIDENTPKDKYILVYDPGYGQLVVIWLEFYNAWMTVFGRKLTHPPTHWQELPKDPK